MSKLAQAAMERAAFHVTEFKTLDAAQGLFEGYLAVFGNEDKTNDIIERGAFAKTLSEAYAVKSKNKLPFIYALLWMHNADDPVGGISDASEDAKGLYIKGQCDLDTERGRTVFSGMQKGYVGELSIGYNAVKSTRDKAGIRHLQEIRLWEGSAVTTGFAANPQALITATKTAGERAVKAVCGKSSWPLASRERAWDGGGAHNRLVAWATKADDTLDAEKMKSVHFWYDTSAPDKITSYKMAFCDIVGGEPQAIPRGIMACAGVLSGARGGGNFGGDEGAMKARVGAYYRRMAKDFDDPTLVAPWDASKIAWRQAVEEKMGGGIQVLTGAIATIDTLYDSIDSCLGMLSDATGMTLDPDEGDEGVGVQMAGETMDVSGAVQPSVAILLDNLPGLRDAFTTLGTVSAAFDDAIDTCMTLLGIPDTDVSEMMASPILDLKVGRRLSSVTKGTLASIADGLQGHCDTLRKMVTGDIEGASIAPSAPTVKMARQQQPEPRATTPNAPTTDPLQPVDEATVAREMSELLLAHAISEARHSL